MKKLKNILVYNYNYSKIGLTIEGEFFLSSIFTFQTEIKAKSKHDFILQYSNNITYSIRQLNYLIKKYEDIIYWDDGMKKFQMEKEVWNLREILVSKNNGLYLSFPRWLFIMNRIYKLNFTQLYIIALLVSYFYDRKEFNLSNETIANKLDMKDRKSIGENIKKLRDEGLITVEPTNRTNILYVTNKLLDYERFAR